MPHIQLEDPPLAGLKPQLVETPSKELVKSLLENAGIGVSRKKLKKTIKELLEEYDIGTEDAVELLSGIAHRGESDAIRLRAIDTALKLGDELKDAPSVPVVNINIYDKESHFEVNPILIPR